MPGRFLEIPVFLGGCFFMLHPVLYILHPVTVPHSSCMVAVSWYLVTEVTDFTRDHR